MATIINNPDSGSSSGGVGLIIGVIAIIAVIALFLLYGLPAIRKNNNDTTINVPDKVQVDINKNY